MTPPASGWSGSGRERVVWRHHSRASTTTSRLGSRRAGARQRRARCDWKRTIFPVSQDRPRSLMCSARVSMRVSVTAPRRRASMVTSAELAISAGPPRRVKLWSWSQGASRPVRLAGTSSSTSIWYGRGRSRGNGTATIHSMREASWMRRRMAVSSAAPISSSAVSAAPRGARPDISWADAMISPVRTRDAGAALPAPP